MKLTIIVEDQAVYVDGVSRLDLIWSGTPQNVRALQWKNGNGWIEFNDGSPNQPIESLPEWATNAVESYNLKALEEYAPPPTPTLQEQFEQVRAALQGAIDTKAREFGFSGGNALILYAGFANPFQTLAKQFAGWEVIVWVEAGQYKQQVLEGSSPMLTPEQAVAMMPGYPA